MVNPERGRWTRRLGCTVAAIAMAAAGASCSSSDSAFGGGNGGGTSSGGGAQGGSGTGGGQTSSGTAGGGGQSGECGANADCPDGEICQAGACLSGCTADHPCGGGLACCSGICTDLSSDMLSCGACDNACATPDHMGASCDAGVCSVGACEPGFFDCDGQSQTGCEESTQCQCTPGSTQPCYPGPPGTEGVGICTGGSQTCNQTGTAWSLCNGYQEPSVEICNNNLDEDCNGTADDVPDIDGDGWTSCDNDCCETLQDCSDPALVNPGAFEFVGNSVDDDCDSATSDTAAPADCSTQSKFGGVSADDLAKAMDLCQFTTQNPPLANRKWGVISAELRLANGSQPSGGQLNDMTGWQGAVLADYGTGGVVPQHGPTMGGISSGRMRDQNDPGYVNPNSGTSFGNNGNPPAAYLAAHSGQLPASASCNGTCPAGSGANDSINLRLSIRVPTNALSFSYKFRFFSAEYWTWACTAYNDFYLALLTSAAANLPADKNISFDSQNNPVSVNNGFFDVCTPKGCYTCPDGTGALQGTGMQIGNTGGATKWLQTTAPIVPGEDMVLELMIFDVSDGILDSLSLLDDFLWSVSASGVGTGPVG